ncbi:hypothetical protein pneo_cds_29 [Pandoravirus neocaledonia]|uniref:Uncharacterized protein n=1 Tax=Pandoravirus neocaledonia TaxID=2107708 RepID=A0A2U7UB35_9VIRU|nr:hypothetical protein pneo_cds_29 [Pandoravirus neocaledonia]AVK75636.1 hypothetical protein pneo_cds_29 [Pandoravirus neocaledonia]
MWDIKKNKRPNNGTSTKSCCTTSDYASAPFFVRIALFFPLTHKNNTLDAINMATETGARTTNTAPTGTEPREHFCLSRTELQSMISGEPVNVCRVSKVDDAPKAAADAISATTVCVPSGTASSPAVAGTLDSSVADAAASQSNTTLTISGLHKMIKAMDDLDTKVEAASVVETVVMRFRLDAATNRVQDDVRVTQQIVTKCLVPDDLSGCAAVSFVGGHPLSARALLKALEPCLEHYGDVRVCVRKDRAVGRLRKTVALCTDSVLFKNDNVSVADAERVRQVVQVGEALVQTGETNMERIAATLSGLMPRHWHQAYYFLDGAFLPNLNDVCERLPTIDKKALSELFVTVGKEPPRLPSLLSPSSSLSSCPLRDDSDHGSVIIHTLVPGLTYAALESAYGPSACKVSRLLSMARAAQSITSVNGDSRSL